MGSIEAKALRTLGLDNAFIPLLRRGCTERTLCENAYFHVAPAGVGIDFDRIGLELVDALWLGERLGPTFVPTRSTPSRKSASAGNSSPTRSPTLS